MHDAPFHSYTINDVEVRFPFKAYDCQIAFMKKVISSLQTRTHGLLESPTGTGKTLCLLCSSLAWRENWKEKLFRGVDGDNPVEDTTIMKDIPKIYYASRTHSQLSQVIKELKQCGYKPKVCVLGSRDQLCLHHEVSRVALNNAQNQLCRQKVAKKSCEFYRGYEANKNRITRGIRDIEDLIREGEVYRSCPYYTARESLATADIIFLPYNYLTSSYIRKQQSIDIHNAVLIFDEAHNLEGSCTESSSFEITSSELQSCINEVEACTELVSSGNSLADVQSLSILKGLLENLKSQLELIPITETTTEAKNGDFIYDVFQKCEINSNTIHTLLPVLDAVSNLLFSSPVQLKMSYKCALGKLSTIFQMLFGNGDTAKAEDYIAKSFKVFITPEVQGKSGGMMKSNLSSGRKLSYWCFNPGVVMDEFTLEGIHSIILTSGTLSPMESFASEMGIDFSNKLENSHIIEKEQLYISVLNKGPSGIQLNSSYQNRSSQNYMRDLGNAIVNFARVVPDGILVFFPSYSVMEMTINYWKIKEVDSSETIWQRFSRSKELMVEPRNKHEMKKVLEDYYNQISKQNARGSMLFAVCRGKVSEGLDFADARGRAVIITGLPYPAAMDPKVKLKKQILDEAFKVNNGKPKLSSQEWYRQQSGRAVNQAIGRVIRHRKDFGAILLCDERFADSYSIKQLSAWIRPHVKTHKAFGQVLGDLVQFFKSNNLNQGNSSGKGKVVNCLPLSEEKHESKLPLKRHQGFYDSLSEYQIPKKISLMEGSEMETKENLPSTSSRNVNSVNSEEKKESDSLRRSVKMKKLYLNIKKELPREQYNVFKDAIKLYKDQKMAPADFVEKLYQAFKQSNKLPLLTLLAALLPSKIGCLIQNKLKVESVQ